MPGIKEMKDIESYYIKKPDGGITGPFTMKGLLMQYEREVLSGNDAVLSSERELLHDSLENFLTTKRGESKHGKSHMPTEKERIKTKLPPLKNKNDIAGDEALAYMDEFVASGKRVKVPNLSIFGLAVFPIITAAMILLLALVHIYFTNNLSAHLFFEKDVASTLDEYYSYLSFFNSFLILLSCILFILFLTWLGRATSNANMLTGERLGIPISNILMTFIIPVYNVWGVYSKTRQVYNASREPDSAPYLRHSMLVAIWWCSLLCVCVLKWKITDEGIATVDKAKIFFSRSIGVDAGIALVSLLTIFLVWKVSQAQMKSSAGE